MTKLILPEGARPARRRSYEAAASNRLTAGWLSSMETPADELRVALPTLRNRARQLANNNEYARRFLSAVRVNVVGPHGITLQSRVGSSGSARASAIDRKVEAAWWRWCQAGVPTLEGRMSFAEWLGHQVVTVARDGEALALYVRGTAARNAFGFALQTLDPAQIDDSKTANDPPIFMGIEHDAAHRAVAYHLRRIETAMPGLANQARNERVPADRVNHPFIIERSLLRGVPWMAPAMLRLHMLGGYQEAEVTAARIASSKMGFYTRSDEAGDIDPDDEEEDGAPIKEVQPGQFEELPAGWDFKAFSPDHPTGAYQSFVTTCLQGISAGFNVPYHELTGDLSQANYSSLREAKLAGSDIWRTLQAWAIDSIIRPVFSRWLEMAITTGELSVSMVDYPRILEAAHWQPRGWAWVDPAKEMEAYEKAITLNLMTRSEILAAQGKDFEETLEQIAREQALMRELQMQQQQIEQQVEQVERCFKAIDRLAERQDEHRHKTAEQFVEIRERTALIGLLREDVATVRKLADENAEAIAKSSKRLAECAERIAAVEARTAEIQQRSVTAEERLATVAEAAAKADAAARGAQKVADRLEARLHKVESPKAESRVAEPVECAGVRLTRSVRLDVLGQYAERDGEWPRQIEVAFSSEEPVERWFGIEVLDHGPGAADLGFVASQRAPLLFNHNPERIIGRVISARIDGDRRGRAVIELPEGDEDAEWAMQKIRAGMLTNVSFGYLINKAEERSDESGSRVVRVTRWEPLEISLVAVPADTTVGLGRSLGE